MCVLNCRNNVFFCDSEIFQDINGLSEYFRVISIMNVANYFPAEFYSFVCGFIKYGFKYLLIRVGGRTHPCLTPLYTPILYALKYFQFDLSQCLLLLIYFINCYLFHFKMVVLRIQISWQTSWHLWSSIWIQKNVFCIPMFFQILIASYL